MIVPLHMSLRVSIFVASLILHLEERTDLECSISLILRQPTMMDVFSDMEASIRRFQNAQAAPSDVFFCEMVQLEQLCQDVGRQLSLSDEREWASVCEDIAVEIARDFQERVKTWKSSCDEDVMQEGEWELMPNCRNSTPPFLHTPLGLPPRSKETRLAKLFC